MFGTHPQFMKNLRKPALSNICSSNAVVIIQIPQLVVYLKKHGHKILFCKGFKLFQFVHLIQFMQGFCGIGIIIPKGMIQIKKNMLVLTQGYL